MAGPAALDGGLVAVALAVSILLAASIAFAAVALLLRLRNHRLDAHTRTLTEAWEPITLDVLAGVAPDGALLERVRPRDAAHFLSFLLGYARRLQGGERVTVTRLARPFLPAVVERTRRGSAEKRGQAVQTLAELGLPEHADAVAAALDDRAPVVAMIAARGLFRRGYEQYFPLVLAHLPRFTIWSRSFLASMLARGGPGTAPFLRQTLSDGTRAPLVRAVSADALRLLNDIEATSLAASILGANEKDRELITACVRILRHLGHSQHVALVRPLVTAADPVVRAAAVGALGAIGGPREVSLLRDVLDDVAYWVSLEAARGLMKLGASATLQRLARSEGPWAVLARQVLSE
jgi:HEAT repeat protein